MYSENALNVYQRLYFLGDETAPEETHDRVAKFMAQREETSEDERYYREQFVELLNAKVFRPNSPMFMNIGKHVSPQLSACFVGDLKDDLISILDFDRDAAIIYASGSGIGGQYGSLREKGAPLSGGGNSSGPISFLKKLEATAECVKSGGKSRRAAHIALMYADHPDIFDFVSLKSSDNRLRNVNLSVAVTDEFMYAVAAAAKWELRGVVDGEVKRIVGARELFAAIVENAAKTGDPGLFFLDRVNRDNTLPSLGRIVAANPCGEKPLHAYQSCALASINVGALCSGTYTLEHVVRIVTRFLDNSIDLSGYPTPNYQEVARLTRPIGVGLMGLADALVTERLPYASQAAREYAAKLAKAVTSGVISASCRLAESRGAFPLMEKNRDAVLQVISRLAPDEVSHAEKHGVRNSQWTTIAPTGSISISADCSAGMEPYFALTFDKRLSDTGEVWTFVNPMFEYAYSSEPWYRSAISQMQENGGSCQNVSCIPESVRSLFQCAHDIGWKDRVLMQAALQDGISDSISSTVNLPTGTTSDDIERIYLEAWSLGLKGITVYVDGSHENQPVAFGSASKEMLDQISRPVVLRGETVKVFTGHGSIYVTINKDNAGRVREVFTNSSKNGSLNSANLEALARVISISLQHGVPLEKLVSTMIGINDGTSQWARIDDGKDRPVMITSIPDAVAKVLDRHCGSKHNYADTSKRCAVCGGQVQFLEGCETCVLCGESKCA